MSLPEGDKEYTYSDYLSWDHEERWEIIEGIPCMKAAPSRIHQEILMELSKQIANFLTGKGCRIYPAPFCVRLPGGNDKDDKEIKNVVEPDITIVCDRSKLDDKGCKGAPDMIIEIVSPSTARKDRIEKFNLYEKAGVKEYWLIEPDEKILSVFVLQDDNRYGRPEMYTEEDEVKVTVLHDLVIDLNSIFSAISE